jgi:hypothetical protein
MFPLSPDIQELVDTIISAALALASKMNSKQGFEFPWGHSNSSHS